MSDGAFDRGKDSSEGKKDVFLGKLQERTGLAKDEAEKQLEAFLSKVVDVTR